MAVYIIAFSEKLSDRASLYVGYAKTKQGCYERLEQHRRGYGAKITAAAVENGIGLEIVFIISRGTRQLERRIKKHKNHRKALERLVKGTFQFKEGDLS